jgi:hypothetical protein
MTADPLAQGLPVSTALDMCDRLLGEAGRRRHVFAWLREPGSDAEGWLPVDAYYPRARLVVICRPAPDPHDGLFRELIPAHGLGLLRLDPDALGEDAAVVEAALAARIFDLEHVPRPAPRTTARPSRPPDPEPAAAAASDAPAPTWTPVKVERTAVVPAVEQGVGLLVGLGLALILIVEVYLGVVQLAFGAGRVMLGFAIALEACSRALGTVAAARAGERGWACVCAIGGAPFVAWYAFWRRSGRAETEPAPLAGLLAGVAVVVAGLALLLGL